MANFLGALRGVLGLDGDLERSARRNRGACSLGDAVGLATIDKRWRALVGELPREGVGAGIGDMPSASKEREKSANADFESTRRRGCAVAGLSKIGEELTLWSKLRGRLLNFHSMIVPSKPVVATRNI